jgi:ankyrin repeat protein
MIINVKSARPALIDAAIDGNIDYLGQLLDSGADPNAIDFAGWTALHFSAQRQDRVQLLTILKAGANVDAQDKHGNTPLWRAVFSYRGDATAIHILKAAGANEDIVNYSGVSPRSLAGTIANYNASEALDSSPSATASAASRQAPEAIQPG